MGVDQCLGRLEAHLGIEGNERADEMAKAGFIVSDSPHVTQGRFRLYGRICELVRGLWWGLHWLR